MAVNKEEVKELLLKEYSYQAIGNIYGVSRERIRQIARSFGLQRFRIKKAQQRKIDQELQQKEDKYGQFFVDGVLTDEKFFSLCRYKFNRKKAQVRLNSTYEWDLTFKDLEWNRVCPVLGLELDYTLTSRAENSPSFDRIDPTKGYVKGNVIIISWRANRIKNDGTLEDFKKIVDYLSIH